MGYGESDWTRKNPNLFKTMGRGEDRYCECGAKLVEGGMFRGTQDHPWRPPRILCDCGRVHQMAGLRVDEG